VRPLICSLLLCSACFSSFEADDVAVGADAGCVRLYVDLDTDARNATAEVTVAGRVVTTFLPAEPGERLRAADVCVDPGTYLIELVLFGEGGVVLFESTRTVTVRDDTTVVFAAPTETCLCASDADCGGSFGCRRAACVDCACVDVADHESCGRDGVCTDEGCAMGVAVPLNLRTGLAPGMEFDELVWGSELGHAVSVAWDDAALAYDGRNWVGTFDEVYLPDGNAYDLELELRLGGEVVARREGRVLVRAGSDGYLFLVGR